MKNHLRSKSISRIFSVAAKRTIGWLLLGTAVQAALSAQAASQPVSLISNSRCGPLALSQLAEAMKLPASSIQSLLAAPAPERGYSAAELLTLAQTNGLALRAVRRPPGAE